MKYSQLLFGTVLGVVVLLYLTTSADCTTCDTKGSHNLTIGGRVFHDELLFKKRITVGKSRTIPKVSKDVVCPPESDSNDYSITSIEVKNVGRGGCVYYKGGGIGHSFVNLLLEGRLDGGFKFEITIYGYK